MSLSVIATSPAQPCYQCCNHSVVIMLNVWFTTYDMCVKSKNKYIWCKQGILELSRQVISIVACCRSVATAAACCRSCLLPQLLAAAVSLLAAAVTVWSFAHFLWWLRALKLRSSSLFSLATDPRLRILWAPRRVARSLEIFSRTVCFSKSYGELLTRASSGQACNHGRSIRWQWLQFFCAPKFLFCS